MSLKSMQLFTLPNLLHAFCTNSGTRLPGSRLSDPSRVLLNLTIYCIFEKMLTSTFSSPAATGVVPFSLTTTFTAPTQCAQSIGGLTMLEDDGFKIWLNAPLPVPGTTIASCYPLEFISSFLLQTSGISQAAFSPLVCPAGYTTQGTFTSSYIACCPR